MSAIIEEDDCVTPMLFFLSKSKKRNEWLWNFYNVSKLHCKRALLFIQPKEAPSVKGF